MQSDRPSLYPLETEQPDTDFEAAKQLSVHYEKQLKNREETRKNRKKKAKKLVRRNLGSLIDKNHFLQEYKLLNSLLEEKKKEIANEEEKLLKMSTSSLYSQEVFIKSAQKLREDRQATNIAKAVKERKVTFSLEKAKQELKNIRDNSKTLSENFLQQSSKRAQELLEKRLKIAASAAKLDQEIFDLKKALITTLQSAAQRCFILYVKNNPHLLDDFHQQWGAVVFASHFAQNLTTAHGFGRIIKKKYFLTEKDRVEIAELELEKNVKYRKITKRLEAIQNALAKKAKDDLSHEETEQLLKEAALAQEKLMQSSGVTKIQARIDALTADGKKEGFPTTIPINDDFIKSKSIAEIQKLFNDILEECGEHTWMSSSLYHSKGILIEEISKLAGYRAVKFLANFNQLRIDDEAQLKDNVIKVQEDMLDTDLTKEIIGLTVHSEKKLAQLKENEYEPMVKQLKWHTTEIEKIAELANEAKSLLTTEANDLCGKIDAALSAWDLHNKSFKEESLKSNKLINTMHERLKEQEIELLKKVEEGKLETKEFIFNTEKTLVTINNSIETNKTLLETKIIEDQKQTNTLIAEYKEIFDGSRYEIYDTGRNHLDASLHKYEQRQKNHQSALKYFDERFNAFKAYAPSMDHTANVNAKAKEIQTECKKSYDVTHEISNAQQSIIEKINENKLESIQAIADSSNASFIAAENSFNHASDLLDAMEQAKNNAEAAFNQANQSFPDTYRYILPLSTEPDIASIPHDTLVVLNKDEQLTVYWVQNGKLMNRSFPEGAVSDIIKNLPNEIGQLSNNKELIDQITMKYGCVYTNPYRKIVDSINTKYAQALEAEEKAYQTVEIARVTNQRIQDYSRIARELHELDLLHHSQNATLFNLINRCNLVDTSTEVKLQGQAKTNRQDVNNKIKEVKTHITNITKEFKATLSNIKSTKVTAEKIRQLITSKSDEKTESGKKMLSGLLKRWDDRYKGTYKNTLNDIEDLHNKLDALNKIPQEIEDNYTKALQQQEKLHFLQKFIELNANYFHQEVWGGSVLNTGNNLPTVQKTIAYIYNYILLDDKKEPDEKISAIQQKIQDWVNASQRCGFWILRTKNGRVENFFKKLSDLLSSPAGKVSVSDFRQSLESMPEATSVPVDIIIPTASKAVRDPLAYSPAPPVNSSPAL